MSSFSNLNLRCSLRSLYQHSIDAARLQEQSPFVAKQLKIKTPQECVGSNGSRVGPGRTERLISLLLPLDKEEKAFTEAIKSELIPWTVDESFLLELLTYSTYCDNFMTTRADSKGL